MYIYIYMDVYIHIHGWGYALWVKVKEKEGNHWILSDVLILREHYFTPGHFLNLNQGF